MKKFILSIVFIYFSLTRIFSVSFPSDSFSKFSNNAIHSFDDDKKESGDGDLFVCVLILGALAIVGVVVGYSFLNTVEFKDYPYAPNLEDEQSEDDKNNYYVVRGEHDFRNFKYYATEYSKNRFMVDSSIVVMPKFGYGNETRFEGLFFPYVGPYFENLALIGRRDFDGSFKMNSFQDNLKLGGQISVFQSDYLTASFIIQYARLFGKDSLDENGIALGGYLRSYPIKPISLEWKFDVQRYSKFNVFESNLQFGYLFKAFEFFAAWKYISFDIKDNPIQENNGFTIGTRYHFRLKK